MSPSYGSDGFRYLRDRALGRIGSADLDAGGGVVLTAPFGFDYVPPFNVRKSGATYSHTFSMDAVKPVSTQDYFVDPVGGNDANAGTSFALRVQGMERARDLIQARGSTTVSRILIVAGTYRYSELGGSGKHLSFGGAFLERDFIVEPCDGSGNVLTGGSEVSRRIISLHDEPIAGSWSLVSGTAYKKPYTTEVPSPGIIDLANLNAKSKPQALRYAPPATTYANEAAIVAGVAAKATEFGQGACFIDTTNKIIYVQTVDGRAPDANLVVLRGGFQSNGANARNLYLIGRFGGTQTVWARDLHLWGGAPLYAPTQWSGEGRNLTTYFADCSFSYGGINGFNADGAGVHTLLRCDASDNYKDGFNYDQNSAFDAGGTAVMRFHELECIADWNGNSSQSDDSDNASSAHVRTQGLRVNTLARRTLNRAFHDIAAALTWNLGCIASDCRQTGVQSGGFASGFLPNTGETSKVWLDGCQSINNAYDLEAYKGGILYYANMDTAGYVNDTATGGTIVAYNSPPVLPGATGTLTTSTTTSSTVLLVFSAASGAVSYQYRLNGAGSWLALAGDKVVTGLTQSTLYAFEVRGVNGDGYGPASNSANGTTQASPTPTDILLNGNFAGGTANWSGFGFSGKSVSGGKAVFAATPAFDGINQTTALLVAGKYYDVTYTISGFSAGTFYAYFSGGTGRNGTNRSANGTYVERLLVNTGNNNFGMQANAGPATLQFDDVSCVGPHDTP